MEKTKLIGPQHTAQLALALALLLTFSTGLKVGRHVANDFRMSKLNQAVVVSGPHFPYQLDEPVRKLALPPILAEASAISYVDGRNVALVQDERGTIYFFSLLKGEISREIPFAKKGDYEGLVVRENQAWVLRSDGDLYHVVDLYNDRPQTVKLETFLKSKDDTEGLSYDAAGGQLLIGLKEPPKLADGRVDKLRAVYAFDLEQQILKPTPFLLLDMKELQRVYNSQVQSEKALNFDPDKKKFFQPSDLAIHPVTGHLYHIAARGQLLVVSDRNGLIHFVRELPSSLFPQPEGISFDPRGNLFIVNEGAGGSGMLLEFTYEPLIKKVEEDESVKNFTLL